MEKTGEIAESPDPPCMTSPCYLKGGLQSGQRSQEKLNSSLVLGKMLFWKKNVGGARSSPDSCTGVSVLYYQNDPVQPTACNSNYPNQNSFGVLT